MLPLLFQRFRNFPESSIQLQLFSPQCWHPRAGHSPGLGKHMFFLRCLQNVCTKNIKVIMPLTQQVCTLCMCMIEAMMHLRNLKRSDDVCRNCRSMTPVYMPCKGSIALNAIIGRQYGANQENQECNRPHLTLNIESVILAS